MDTLHNHRLLHALTLTGSPAPHQGIGSILEVLQSKAHQSIVDVSNIWYEREEEREREEEGEGGGRETCKMRLEVNSNQHAPVKTVWVLLNCVILICFVFLHTVIIATIGI